MEEEDLKKWWSQVFVQILIVVLIGFGSSWLTAKEALEKNDLILLQHRKEMEMIARDVERLDGFDRDVLSKLASIESKVDLLVDDRIRRE